MSANQFINLLVKRSGATSKATSNNIWKGDHSLKYKLLSFNSSMENLDRKEHM